jgi:hypothetical protein
MFGPSNNKNSGDNREDGERPERERDENAGDSSQPQEMPDLGKPIANGTYVMSVESEDSKKKEIVSAGTVHLYEHGIAGREHLDRATLQMLGVTNEKAAERALCGDNGMPNDSSISVGYNPTFAKGWNNIWGQDSNN